MAAIPAISKVGCWVPLGEGSDDEHEEPAPTPRADDDAAGGTWAIPWFHSERGLLSVTTPELVLAAAEDARRSREASEGEFEQALRAAGKWEEGCSVGTPMAYRKDVAFEKFGAWLGARQPGHLPAGIAPPLHAVYYPPQETPASPRIQCVARE